MFRKRIFYKNQTPGHVTTGQVMVAERPRMGNASDAVFLNVPTIAPKVKSGPVAPRPMEDFTIPTVVRRFFTTVDGTVIDKNDASIPDNMKVPYPVFLFSQFDRNGGYFKSLSIRPPMGGSKYLMTFVYGINMPFLAFTGFNTMNSILRAGDIVQVYTDSVEDPQLFVWIVTTSQQVSLASIISNTESRLVNDKVGALYVNELNYYTEKQQFDQPLYYAHFDNLGNFKTDTINPNQQLTPNVAQEGFLTIPVKNKLDQYFGLSLYINFATDAFQMDFQCNKV